MPQSNWDPILILDVNKNLLSWPARCTTLHCFCMLGWLDNGTIERLKRLFLFLTLVHYTGHQCTIWVKTQKHTHRTTSTAPGRTLGSLPMSETLAAKEPSMLNTTHSIPLGSTVRNASALVWSPLEKHQVNVNINVNSMCFWTSSFIFSSRSLTSPPFWWGRRRPRVSSLQGWCMWCDRCWWSPRCRTAPSGPIRAASPKTHPPDERDAEIL